MQIFVILIGRLHFNSVIIKTDFQNVSIYVRTYRSIMFEHSCEHTVGIQLKLNWNVNFTRTTCHGFSVFIVEMLLFHMQMRIGGVLAYLRGSTAEFYPRERKMRAINCTCNKSTFSLNVQITG